MPDSSPRSPVIRFGVFEVDLRSGELRKSGLKIKLQDQPFQVLAMLLERPGEVVTREELEKKVWGAGTFVDFEHSLATALKKVREALGDSAENPRFVETLPKRGYRFIYPVDLGAGLKPAPATSAALRWAAIAAAGVVLVAAVLLALNIAGLRDRLMAVGAGLVPALGRPRGAPLPKIESIAVLPLENLSRDPEQEYFADGMTDALITDLGKISALRVISRTSVMRYKQTKKPLPEIAKELNVDAVVEGTVQRSGNRVRITANLLHAPTDRHLWAERYERDLRDVLMLQSEIAQAIVREVRIKVTPEERARLGAARAVDPEVYNDFLMAGWELSKRTEEGFRKSSEYLQRAIDKDPGFAPAYVALVNVWTAILVHGHDVHPAEATPKARAAALKAVELDDTLADAHVALAAVKIFDWDWTGAERGLKRALELNPNSYSAHNEYSQYLTVMGRFDEAMEERRRAGALDPRRRWIWAWTYFYARRWDDAIRELRAELAGGGAPWVVHEWLASSHYFKGMHAEALAHCGKAREALSQHTFTHCGYIYGALGRRPEALMALRQELSKAHYVDPLNVATLYAGIGEKDKAIEWLNKAYDQRSPNMWAFKVWPFFDPLRSDPRFQDLLRRMNFPP